MIRKYSRVRRVVAAPPPLATNTRTVVVNSYARGSCSSRRCVFASTRDEHSDNLRQFRDSSSIHSMSAVGIMNRKFLIACGV